MILPYFNGERPLCNWSPTRVQPLATGYRTSSLKNIVFRSLMYSRVHLVNLERSNGVQHGSLKLLSRDAYAIPYVIIEYLPKWDYLQKSFLEMVYSGDQYSEHNGQAFTS
ncbi:uncharacterized protein [Malus domestica]|uniref:uncharacterized protein isoform X2 n=1 Tax=Malus domestica TaxID=3750 RepID=UPI0039751E0D